jgi:hypothetical protein
MNPFRSGANHGSRCKRKKKKVKNQHPKWHFGQSNDALWDDCYDSPSPWWIYQHPYALEEDWGAEAY